MDKKKFIIGSLLRSVPFLILLVVTLVMKFSGYAADDWWGWYLMYLLIFAALIYFGLFFVRNGKTLVIESVMEKMRFNSSKAFLEKWDAEGYDKQSVLNYVYQSEHDMDTTMAFHENDVTVKRVVRDMNGDVTGETEEKTYAYSDVKSLAVVDIEGMGSVHIEFEFSDGQSTFAYFDVDLAKFMTEKTGLELKNILQLQNHARQLVESKTKNK